MSIAHPGDLLGSVTTAAIFLCAYLLEKPVAKRHPKLARLLLAVAFLAATLFGWWINTVWS
jgi:hypothetical protein